MIVSHALGKTGSVIGEAWPIDAAVAYTLVSHGPDAELTWADFVNQNTRIATVMMSGRVGYAYHGVPNPQISDCGHDMVNCYIHNFPKVILNTKGHLVFQSINNGNMQNQEWFREGRENGSIPDSIMDLVTFRDDCKNKHWLCIFQPRFDPLRELIENHYGTTSWNIPNDIGHTEVMSVEHTKGECAWKDDPEQQCGHHDGPITTGWCLVKQEGLNGDILDAYEVFWRRGKGTVVSHNWNLDHLQNKIGWNYTNNLEKNRVVLFDRVKRSLAQSVPEHQVIDLVKDSLNRMRRWDGRCLVHKTGRGKTAKHRWNNWNWLAEMTTWVQDTLSKNRKENETQCSVCFSSGVEDEEGNSYCECGQGWRYVKYDARMSYGHEIAKFEWRPIEEPKAFSLRVGGQYNGRTLPYRFQTLEQAGTFRQFLNQMVTRVGGSHKERTWDETEGKEVVPTKGAYKIVKLNTSLAMKWDKDPEELPTPQQALDAVLYGTPFENAQATANLKSYTVGNNEPVLKIVNKIATPENNDSETVGENNE